MNGPEILIPLMGISAVFGIPMMAIWTSHVRKLAEIKSRGDDGKGASALRQEVEALRAEVAALRDTTTKFDISFDAQLTQLETRLERTEEKNLRAYGATEAPQTQNVGR